MIHLPETIRTTVFEAAPGGGNPCPVTLYADGLSDSMMQEMSRVWGQEASFVFVPTEPGCDFHVRYFLPLHELSMCIHATIGTAVVIVEKGLMKSSPFYFQSGCGRVRVDWERKADGAVSVVVAQFLPEFKTDVPSRAEIADVLGIATESISTAPIVNASTSRFKLLVPLVDRSVLDTLSPDWERLWNLCDSYGTTGIYVFTVEGGRTFFARQFPNRGGYNEDPATGVAASALCAYAIQYAIINPSEGWNSIKVYQGFAMGRPSVIRADTLVENGLITGTRVGGSARIDERT